MKLINSRFRIDEILFKGSDHESYIVSDLLNRETKRILRLFTEDKNRDSISYYIKDYLNLKKIKHKNILRNIDFAIVDSIDLEKTNKPIYYSLKEYINWPLLSNYKRSIKFKDKLRIILDIMNAIDYLHSKNYI